MLLYPEKIIGMTELVDEKRQARKNAEQEKNQEEEGEETQEGEETKPERDELR